MNRIRYVHTTAEVMKMEEPKTERNDRMERFRLFLRNNGFYIALVVCLVVIGGAILLLALGGPKEEEEADANTSDPITVVGQSNDQHISDLFNPPEIKPAPAVRTPAPTVVPLPTAVPTPVPTAEPTKKPSGTSSNTPRYGISGSPSSLHSTVTIMPRVRGSPGSKRVSDVPIMIPLS